MKIYFYLFSFNMSKRKGGILRYFSATDETDQEESENDNSTVDPDYQIDGEEQMDDELISPNASHRYINRGKPDGNTSQLLEKVEGLLKSNDPSLQILHIQGKGADGWKYGCEIMVKDNVLPYRFCRICLEAKVPILKQ